MNKTIVFSNHADNPIFCGLSSALATVTNTILWNPNIKSVLDMIDEQNPTIIFCHPNEVSNGLLMAMDENPQLKVVLLGVGVTKCNIEPTLWCIPQSIPAHVKENLSNSVECPIYQCPLSANTVQYNQGKLDESLSSDVLFISKNSRLSTQQIDILLSLFDNQDWKIRICGKPVPIHQYTGELTLSDENQLLFNTKIGLDLTGETIFEFGINKKPCITTMPNKFIEYTMQNSQYIISLIKKLLSEPKLAKSMGKSLYKNIYRDSTYYHRTIDIMNLLKEQQISTDCSKKLESHT